MSFSFIPPNLALQQNAHPLDGVYARLDRADDNIRTWTSNCENFGPRIRKVSALKSIPIPAGSLTMRCSAKTPATAAKIGPEFKGTMDFIGSPYVPGSSDVTGYVHAPLVTGFVDIASGGRMDVDFQSSTEVAFKQVGTRQGEPVIPTLEHLAKSVRDLITRFKNDPRLF